METEGILARFNSIELNDKLKVLISRLEVLEHQLLDKQNQIYEIEQRSKRFFVLVEEMARCNNNLAAMVFGMKHALKEVLFSIEGNNISNLTFKFEKSFEEKETELQSINSIAEEVCNTQKE